MSKLPEKVQYLLDNDVEDYSFILKDKINEIIDYLEQYEQQKQKHHEFKGHFEEANSIIEQQKPCEHGPDGGCKKCLG